MAAACPAQGCQPYGMHRINRFNNRLVDGCKWVVCAGCDSPWLVVTATLPQLCFCVQQTQYLYVLELLLLPQPPLLWLPWLGHCGNTQVCST
jgi:hypothetical protein